MLMPMRMRLYAGDHSGSRWSNIIQIAKPIASSDSATHVSRAPCNTERNTTDQPRPESSGQARHSHDGDQGVAGRVRPLPLSPETAN